MNCYLDLSHISTDYLVNLIVIIILRSVVLAHAAVVSIECLNLFASITNNAGERLDDLVHKYVNDRHLKRGGNVYILTIPFNPGMPIISLVS